MQGTEVYGVLKHIGATHLHHANSVTTSCTFLEQGGLLSRGFVEDHGLKQTAQYSDQKDKQLGIWHRIFLDHVDIHVRGGRKKGPNQYGPVLFVLDISVLLSLPAGSDVMVTKSNPVEWFDSLPDGDRWYQGAEELVKNILFGDFKKMLVIQTPSGSLDFPEHRARIVLDDPQRRLASGEDGYTHAEGRLKKAAAAGQVEACIERRKCWNECICVKKYSKYNTGQFDYDFS